MRPEFVEKSIAQRRQILWIVWGAFISSILVYGLLAMTVPAPGVSPAVAQPPAGAPATPAPAVDPVVPIVLLAMGLMSTVGAVAIRVLGVSPDRVIPDRNTPPPPAPAAPESIPVDQRPDSPAETRFLAALQRLFVVTVVTWAMMESAAVFGLLLYFLTGKLTHAGVLWGASLVGFLVLLPPGRDFHHEIARKIV